jgi:hypothetical protein
MSRREFLKTAASCLGALGFVKDSWGAQVSGVDAGSSKAASAGANGICLNQIGVLPDSSKLATVSTRAGSFLVRSLRDNSVALRSTLSAQRLDNASGDSVQFADFSTLKVPGEYRIELDSGVSGDSFLIRKDAYDNALLLTMRSFYGQDVVAMSILAGDMRIPSATWMQPSTRPPGKRAGATSMVAGTMPETTVDT